MLLSFEKERHFNESLVISVMISNTQFFYTYAKCNAKIKTKIGPYIERWCDPKSTAEVLRDQYDSVYRKHDENCLVDHCITLFSTTDSESPSLTNIDFERQVCRYQTTLLLAPIVFRSFFLKNAQLNSVFHYNTVESVVPVRKNILLIKNYKGNSYIKL